MSALRERIPFPWIATCLLLVPLHAGTAAQTPRQAQVQVQVQAQMQAQARRAAVGPMKLDVHPLTHAPRVGSKVSVEVSLRDSTNQLAVWNRPSQLEVEVTGPSGKPEKHTVTIPPGQSSVQFTFDASEPGLVYFKARETNDTLLPGGNSVLVTGAQAGKKSRKMKRSASRLAPAREPAHLLPVAAHVWEPPTPLAVPDWTEQGPGGVPDAAPPSAPELLLTNSSGKDEILADGKDFARIKVYFMDPQGEPAPSDIKVWLTWSNGELHPHPLVIKKGKVSAEAVWASRSPVEAKLSLVISAPKYAVEGTRELKVPFVPPIYGIGPSSPNPLKLSLIDCEPVVAQFFDEQGRTVQTSKPRRVTFISSNPALRLDPSSRDVQPNESGASIFVLPTWRGRSTLDIWTPGYDHQTLVVEVKMWLVLMLCLSGGVAGGIAAKETLKGSVAWRIFVGILGAIVLVWICVYAV